MSFLPTVCLAVAALTLNPTQPVKRTLKSISITPAVGHGASAKFVAAGSFTAPPVKETRLPVSWYLMGPGIDPPGAEYSLIGGSHLAGRCAQGPAETAVLRYTVIALAPANPKAPRSGPVPSKVFQDLVINHTKTSEDGFVAATAVLTCQ